MATFEFNSAILERDIDHLLLEEFCVCEDFQRLIFERAYEGREQKIAESARHSVSSDNLGESDLLFIIQSTEDVSLAIMIENKVDATSQERQGFRYRERGEAGKARGEWADFRTCIIAPEAYLRLGAYKKDGEYDLEISFESVIDFFSSKPSVSARDQFKISKLQKAVVKGRPAPKFVTDNSKKFFEEYSVFAEDRGVNVEINPAYVIFKFPGMPGSSSLCHYPTKGIVKLFLANDYDTVLHLLSPIRDGMTLENPEVTGLKRPSVLVNVGVIDPDSEDFTDKRLSVDAVFEAANVLSKLGNVIAQALG